MLKLLPPSMLHAIDLLPPTDIPVSLFTRHSLREMVSGQGLAGYDLQLTPQGRDLALHWGHYLTTHSDRVIQHCISSPIQRCVDTAALMLQGASAQALDRGIQTSLEPKFIQPEPIDSKNSESKISEPKTSEPKLNQSGHIEPEIIEQGLLVEPGSFVVDIKLAAPYFREQGALGFINSFINQRLPGMKHPIGGVVDVLALLYHSQSQQTASLSLAVSHDTILAAILAVIAGRQNISPEDWPEMMEGMFVWFEGDDFEHSRLKWIWRGQLGVLNIEEFKKQQGVLDLNTPSMF